MAMLETQMKMCQNTVTENAMHQNTAENVPKYRDWEIAIDLNMDIEIKLAMGTVAEYQTYGRRYGDSLLYVQLE